MLSGCKVGTPVPGCPQTRTTKKDTPEGVSLHLCHRIQHILDKNPISPRWIIHQNVGDSANQFPILYDGTAGHE